MSALGPKAAVEGLTLAAVRELARDGAFVSGQTVAVNGGGVFV
ncbi:hypothetical protein ABZ639_31500 [Saccharomonospora sp. NPDC006951]